tara:strand:+ start:710 stop:1222 length:513 start_codon:yes stop_codon:yes gene_type:complete
VISFCSVVSSSSKSFLPTTSAVTNIFFGNCGKIQHHQTTLESKMSALGKEIGTFFGKVTNQIANKDKSTSVTIETENAGPFGAIVSTGTFHPPSNPDAQTGLYNDIGFALNASESPIPFEAQGVWRETAPGGHWEAKVCAVNAAGMRVFAVLNFKFSDRSVTATLYELDS